MPLTAGCPVEHPLSNSQNSGSFYLWSQLWKGFKYLPSFFDFGPAFWQNIFFPLLFSSDKMKQEKASQKMFLHVLNSCCIFYLHFKKSSVILCYLNPIFCHSFLLYSTPCFRCKDQLLLNLFFSSFLFYTRLHRRKGSQKKFFFGLFLVGVSSVTCVFVFNYQWSSYSTPTFILLHDFILLS